MSAFPRILNDALALRLTLTSIRPLENIPEKTTGATVIGTAAPELAGNTWTQTAGAGR